MGSKVDQRKLGQNNCFSVSKVCVCVCIIFPPVKQQIKRIILVNCQGSHENLVSMHLVSKYDLKCLSLRLTNEWFVTGFYFLGGIG